MKRLLLLPLFLLLSSAAFAQNCVGPSKPTITVGPNVVVNGPTSVTITWTTMENASSGVIYGDDSNTLGGPSFGSWWALADQSVGVTSHSITLTNLDTSVTYNYGVQSRCFTAGNPDKTLSTTSARGSFTTATGTVTAGQLTIAYQPSLHGSVVIPIQDGTHNGFHAWPGYGVVIPLYAEASVIPSGGYNFGGHGGATFTLSSTSSLLSMYATTGTQANYNTRSAWSGAAITVNSCGGNQWRVCGALDLSVAANTPTSGSGCTGAGGTDLGGGKGCAYPLSITLACVDMTPTCTVAVANPATLWIIVQAPTFPSGTVGPINGTGHIPCQHAATKIADNCLYPITAGSLHDTYQSFDDFYTTWAPYYDLATYKYNFLAEGCYFYNGDYVTQNFSAYAGYTGATLALWKQYQLNCSHAMMDHYVFNMVQEATNVTFVQNGVVTLNGNATCNSIYSANGNTVCGTVTIPAPMGTDLSALATGLASGYTYECLDATKGGSADAGHILSVDNMGKTVTCESYVLANTGNGDTWTFRRELNMIAADATSNSNLIVSAGTDFAGFYIVTVHSGGGGSSYVVGDVVTITGLSATAKVTGVAMGTGAVTSLAVIASQPYAPGSNLSTTGGTGSGLIVDVALNGTQVCYIPTSVGSLLNGLVWWAPTQPGALVSAVDVVNHKITLSGSGISGFTTGTKFQCRKWTQPLDIFFWTEVLYADWLTNGNYLAVDAINEFSLTEQFLPTTSTDREREVSEMLETCRHVIDIQHASNYLTTAVVPATDCTNATFRQTYLDMLITMADIVANNGAGNGSTLDTFLTGLHGFTLIRWAGDPLMGATTDPRINWWVKQIADHVFTQNYQIGLPGSPLYNSYYNQYFHESPYEGDGRTAFGILDATSFTMDGGQAVSVYWSEQGLIWPMYAYLYNKTGNAVIPNSGGTTYGAAYLDMFSNGVVLAFNATEAGSSVYLGKTLGQLGLWQLDGFTYAQGSSGSGGGGVAPAKTLLVMRVN